MPQRVDGVVEYLAGALPTAPRMLPAPRRGFAALGVAGWLLRGAADRGDLEAVLRSVPNNVTTEMNLELWQLAVRIRTDPASSAAFDGTAADELAARYLAGELPGVLQDGMAEFLAGYGQRSVAEIDLGMPRWAEDPAHLFGVLAGYLRLPDEQTAPDRHFAQGAQDAAAMVDTLVGRARRRGRVRGAIVQFCLRRTRALAGLREMPKFLMITAVARARTALLDIGEELQRSGVLADPADVFFLDFDRDHRSVGGVWTFELASLGVGTTTGTNCTAGTSRGWCCRMALNPRRSARRQHRRSRGRWPVPRRPLAWSRHWRGLCSIPRMPG